MGDSVMSWTMTGLSGIALLFMVMFFFRIPVGFAMAIVGFLGYWYLTTLEAALAMSRANFWTIFSSYGVTVIPLFILMGEIIFHSKASTRLYDTAHKFIGHLQGGLAMATVLACAGFSTICGSNSATAATMTAVAMPEMKKYGYNGILSLGSIASGATLGCVIPPSTILIVIGLQTGQSIGDLFLGGIGPGVLITVFFLLSISFMCIRHLDWGPADEQTSWRTKMASLPGSIEIVLLFLLVIGGLFAGWFTPTEAGAAGGFFALVIALSGRNLNWSGFLGALDGTMRIACMVLVIITGAVIFGRFLTLTRIPFELADWVAALDLPRALILIMILVLYLVGGAIMDTLAFLVITLPIFFPVAAKLGYDPIWFSVVITIMATIGSITPPVGINAYVVAAVDDEAQLQSVFRGSSYFLPAYFVTLVLLMLFPQIVTFFPSLLR